MNQVQAKDLITLTLSLAILSTFCTSLVFWQPSANAARSIPVRQPSSDLQQEGKEVALLKHSLLEEKRAKQAEAELALENKYRILEQDIANFLQQQPGLYGFCLYVKEDLLEQQVEKSIGYNQNEVFKMASTFKLPVNLYLYHQVAENKLSLDAKFLYSKGYYETGTGSLQYLPPGRKYSARELASRSIRESDNVAVNILVGALGREGIFKFMQGISGRTLPDQGTPVDTPQNLVAYMKAAVEFAEVNPELGNLLLDDLKNTIFSDRIRAGTPPEVAVGHKVGNLAGTVNDVGIVFARKPYILAVMSKNVSDDSSAAEVEAQVAKMVYESIGH